MSGRGAGDYCMGQADRNNERQISQASRMQAMEKESDEVDE